MAVRASQNIVPKLVTFYKNGDRYFRGHKLAITPQKYRNMETLLNDLTRLLNLPLGARYVLTKTGKAVENVQEFENGQGYICSSFPKLKNMRYGVSDNLPYWNSSKHINKEKATQSTKHFKSSNDESPHRKRSDTIKPRIITVIRYGHKPRRSAKVLLNKRTAQTLDQVLDEVTLAIGVWGTNGVRRLYDLTGKRVNELSDLFKQDDCFIAVGNEKLNLSDLEDIIQGSNLKPSQKTRLPSINSAEESDASQSDHHTPSRKVQSKNSVKLPSIRRKSNNESNPSPRSPPVTSMEFKENKVQTQTAHITPKEGKKKSCQNNHNSRSSGKNHTLKDVSDQNNFNDRAKISQEETKSSPKDKSCGLASSRAENNDQSRKKIENVEDVYMLGEKIGDGNFAVVRIGTNKDTKVKHALKIIDRKKIIGKENMLKDEIRIMKACNHENIVKLYDTLDTLFDVYLVMELITGGDLFDEISNAVKFEEPVASLFAQDIANALHYLHVRNIVHRDLKPENLMVHISSDGNKQLKLADFGLAVQVRVPLYTVCGTPTYVAPEILEETGYGLKVDIWAAGVILYIMLCGFPPFRSPNKDQDELFDLIIAGDYEFLAPYWDDTSQDAKDLVSKLLVVDSKQRFTAQEILNHHWIQNHDPRHKDEDLSISTPKREFNAKRKFKGAAIAVTSSNRLQNIVQFQFKRGEKLLDQRS